MKKTLITLSGPTASGKTALAIRIAKTLQAEIFSCDSRQFYKEMSIGTAVPTTDELAEVQHHFIQHKSIHSPYSVGQYEAEAIALLTDYFEDHDVAVMVGGSGLYMQAVVNGIDKFPEASEEIRNTLASRLAVVGLSVLQQELQELDPVHYKNVDKQNPSRILRALSVCLASGKPYSSFLGQNKQKRPFEVLALTVDIPRQVLYDRINKRVDQMMNAGMLQEAQKLYLHRSLNALQTVGYKEIFDFFEEKISLDRAIELTKQHTRHYAKRQMTWVRRKEVNAHKLDFDCTDSELKKHLSLSN
jgi:tRNA dimethylallyltransferase